MTSSILSAIDAEVERSEREADFARRIRAFAAQLYDANGASTGPAAGRRNAAARPSAGNPTRDEICALVHREGPLRRGQVHARLGGNIDSVGDKLQRLARAGRIEAIGPASRRAYRAPVRTSLESRRGSRTDVIRRSAVPPHDDLGEVAATIAAQSGALDERRISLATRIPVERVETACAELSARRAVVRTDRGTFAVVSR